MWSPPNCLAVHGWTTIDILPSPGLGGHAGVSDLAQGLAEAQPLTPWVAQARPWILSLPELKHRVGCPDTSRVSEANSLLLIFSFSPLCLPTWVLLRPAHESMLPAPPTSEYSCGYFCFSTGPHSPLSPGPQQEAEREHVRKQGLTGFGALLMPALRSEHLPNLNATQQNGPCHQGEDGALKKVQVLPW